MCMTQAGGFMPAKDIGIDLGTRNSLVFSTGKGIVLREPSVVVYDKDTEKIRAIGEEARQMASHLTSNMEVIWPIRRGVIVDYNVMEKMLKYFISQAMGRRAFRKPRVSISVPSGITEIERKAIEEAAYQSGAREVFLVDEPIAAAIGAGVDITKPFGNLIVDIGAGTTDVAVISVGGVVVSASVKVAGDNFDHAIMNYVCEKHSLFIGEDAAENIKIKIGTASEEADLRTMEVKGRNIITGLPKVATLTSEEIRTALRETTGQISMIEHLLTQYDTENDAQKREKLLAGAAVLGAYIKRYGNLLLVSHREETADIRDLSRCFEDSFVNLELLDVKCLCALPADVILATKDMLRIYRTFETVLEDCLFDLHSVWVNARERKGQFLVSIDFVCDTDLSGHKADADLYSCEDGTCRFTFQLQKGGEGA